LICVEIGYLTNEVINIAFNLCEEVGKMLSSIIKKINSGTAVRGTTVRGKTIN